MAIQRYHSEREMEDLPYDIICNIFSRLPTKFLLRFKMVCKSWCNLTQDPYLITYELDNASNQQCSFMVAPKELNGSSSLFLLDKDQCSIFIREGEVPVANNLPTMYAQIVSSCNGVLCLFQKFCAYPLFVYNPITKGFLRLPKLPETNSAVGSGDKDFIHLGFDRKIKKYKVVRMYYLKIDDDDENPCYVKGDIVTLGDSSWRELDVPYRPGFTLVLNHNADPAIFDGAFHWIVRNGVDGYGPKYILAMDIAAEKFRVIKLPQSILEDNEYNQIEIVTLGASVAIVGYKCYSRSIWKLVNSNGRKFWTRQYKYDMSLIKNPYRSDYDYEVIDMLGEDSLLMAVRGGDWSDDEEESCRIVIYRPRKKDSCCESIRGVPEFFYVFPFVSSHIFLRF